MRDPFLVFDLETNRLLHANRIHVSAFLLVPGASGLDSAACYPRLDAYRACVQVRSCPRSLAIVSPLVITAGMKRAGIRVGAGLFKRLVLCASLLRHPAQAFGEALLACCTFCTSIAAHRPACVVSCFGLRSSRSLAGTQLALWALTPARLLRVWDDMPRKASLAHPVLGCTSCRSELDRRCPVSCWRLTLH